VLGGRLADGFDDFEVRWPVRAEMKRMGT